MCNTANYIFGSTNMNVVSAQKRGMKRINLDQRELGLRLLANECSSFAGHYKYNRLDGECDKGE